MLRQLLLCALVLGCSDPSTTVKDEGAAGSGGTSMIDIDSGAGAPGMGGEAGSDGDIDLGPPPAGDTCDDIVDANEVGSTLPDGTLVVTGTNMGARHDLEACDTSSAPLADVVYSYTAEATGGLRWTLDSVTPTRFVADVRTACSDSGSTLVCDDCGIRCVGDLEVTAGDTLYFAIFGLRTTKSPDGTGTFDLSLLLTPDPGVGDACMSPRAGGRACPDDTVCQDAEGETPICGEPACGDGLLSFEPLGCEDGNTASNDGCSPLCEPDMQGAGSASCESPITLNLPRMRAILDDTVFSYAAGAGDFVDGSDLDASCSDAAGPEAVYVFELLVASHVAIGAENAEVLSVRRATDTDCGTEELGCTTGSASSPFQLELDLEPGRYAVILDREEPTLASTLDYVVDVFVQNR